MSSVAISGQTIEKVVREAREHPNEQVVGVLLGGQFGGSIVIEDTATGPAESDSRRATLTGDSIARIADDIINKRIRGSIVGWYHSHVSGGVFMSETDVETQLNLQQFSPLVTAMVIDAQSGKSGFFRADPKTKAAVPVLPEDVKTGVPAPVPVPAPIERAWYPQAPAPQQQAPKPISTRTILLAVLLITLGVTAGIVALVYYAPAATTSTGNLSVKHIPPRGPFRIANPLTFDANVTGSNLQNVTLAYRIVEQAARKSGVIVGDLVRVPMLLKAAGKDTYSYTIPSSEISGLYIQYYISAFDSSNPPNVVRTDVYNLDVGDFDWHDEKTEVTVVRTVQSSVSLPLDSIHGFNDPVSIKITSSPPLGLRIIAVNAQVAPPSSAVLLITSTDNAQIARDYEIEIDAVYAVHAVQIIRPTTLSLTVTDFAIDVSPTYQKAQRCSYDCEDKNALYTVKLIVYDGFTSPNGIKLSVIGLPAHTTAEVLLVDYRIATDETATAIYTLRIHATYDATADKYLLEVKATASWTGGSISHSVANIQLEIVD